MQCIVSVSKYFILFHFTFPTSVHVLYLGQRRRFSVLSEPRKLLPTVSMPSPVFLKKNSLLAKFWKTLVLVCRLSVCLTKPLKRTINRKKKSTGKKPASKRIQSISQVFPVFLFRKSKSSPSQWRLSPAEHALAGTSQTVWSWFRSLRGCPESHRKYYRHRL